MTIIFCFLYYRYNFDELRDFRDSLNIKEDEENKRFGASLNFYYGFDYITFQLLGDYQKIITNFQNNYGDSNNKDEHYSIAGLVSLHTLDQSLKLSIFYKSFHWEMPNLGNYSGVGVDLKYVLNNSFSFYAGYSIKEEYWNGDASSFEAGVRCNYSGLLLDAKYFNNEHFDYRYGLGGPEIIRDRYEERIRGAGLDLNYKFWLLLLETNTSYYFKVEDESPINLPDWQFVGGIYVNNLFFENNLDLKAGFQFYYTGTINTSLIYNGTNITVDPTNKLDFTLAGEIKKVAIVYFIWENLFDNKYYITPYYPMPERNIRFGLAWELFN